MNPELVYYPDPILRAKARPVTHFDPGITDLANHMRLVMKNHAGMGLAAQQVGDPRRIIIVEYPGDEAGTGAIAFKILINPKITSQNKETDTLNEGCLSIPYVEVSIVRSLEIIVSAQDVEGKPVKIKAKGLFARILQHEIDHLDGKLILDYDPSFTRKAVAASKKPSVIVWGSTEFTIGVLNSIRPSMNVTHIVTEPAKPAGRGQVLSPSVVKKYADTLGIATLEPNDLTDPRVLTYLLSSKPDVMIVAAYGRLIPDSLYSLPPHGTLNVHPSLLPRHRGPTPIQAVILSGDKQTGVTIMKLAPKFDTGELVAQAPIQLVGTESYQGLEYALAELGGEVLNHIIVPYLKGELELMPQNELEASITKKITAADRWLNLEDSPVLNERKVRAYFPKPGAFVILNGQTIKVMSAELENDRLVFNMVQPAGKRPMNWDDFVRGYRHDLKFEPYKDRIIK